jgi:hypothetical protein
MARSARWLALSGFLSMSTVGVWAADSYDAHSRQLTIPAITIGGATYSNMVVTVGKIVTAPTGGVPLGGVDTYDPATRNLTVPAVVLGTVTYSNAVVTVDGVVSIGGVTGADIYDGKTLALPSVKLGSTIYRNVVITVGGIVSAGGGLPSGAIDTYDLSTRQLTVSGALDTVNHRVYTNAVLTVGKILSVGGIANSGQLVAEHSLTEAGLAVGFVSTVLQSQLALFEGFGGSITACAPLAGSNGGVLSGSVTGSVAVFYDAACTRPYIATVGSLTSGNVPGGTLVAETATYYDPVGNPIGSLALNETFVLTLVYPASSQVDGLGFFTPTSGIRTPVQIGVSCTVPLAANISPETLTCSGAVAEDFPALGLSIGVVAPITLVVAAAPGGALIGQPMTFSGAGLTATTGPLGALSLTAPTATTLAVTGGTPSATYALSGSSAAFSLFPATPTRWTVTDSFSGLTLQVAVASNALRNLTLTISQGAGGATVATGALDQSGSGTITFSDGRQEPITSWTLGSATS